MPRPTATRWSSSPSATRSIPWLYKLKFDAEKSFTPIAQLAAGASVLAVNPGLPVKSVKDLLDYAKANPGKLNMAHAGVGSFQHLSSSLLLQLTKLDMVLVPFKGGVARDDRRDRRPQPCRDGLAGAGDRPYQRRQAAGARHRQRQAAVRLSRTGRRSPRPACPATTPTTGGASWARPACPSRSSTS